MYLVLASIFLLGKVPLFDVVFLVSTKEPATVASVCVFVRPRGYHTHYPVREVVAVKGFKGRK